MLVISPTVSVNRRWVHYTSLPEYTTYTSQFAPEVDPLMSDHTSTHHGHILDPSWSPPPYRTAVGTSVTPLAPLSTTCLSTIIPSASTLFFLYSSSCLGSMSDNWLFELGLELSLARLKALAKFAFGMGLRKA
ncbi:hypothetical protein LOK49_LG02G02785 [Camellia lanceoleosa]|uniref:Uncharacterized protein n=1 Tax=Camellia lanceoleosa TaxID=1840588 RepID=A0ACC0ILZ1_9ERIC|nr:hypothetical protein LOK49_LG02G02785 [Camellia lanceoleosa]